MVVLNFFPGALPNFSLRMKPSDTLSTIRERAAAKIRLDLKDGIPLSVKYGHGGKSYTLEDGELDLVLSSARTIAYLGKFPPNR